MIVKTKRQFSGGVSRLETGGELKEILVNEDIMNSENTEVALCFRGQNSSGIVKLTKKEIDILNEEISKKILNKVKVIKYKK